MKRALMVQGCTSDAGKTTVVAGLCRLFQRMGYKVAPFKPQNMALNSAVTEDGGEIGRAQALQAQACGLSPHTDMNPILIKPSTDTQAQVIVQGKALTQLDAADYHAYKAKAMEFVVDSFTRLGQQYEYIVVEGAGSPAEINLRENDIANMGFAETVDCPVVIVADIDKGGVFAHLVGTLDLLSTSEKNRVIGFVINKFRGDLSLLEPGLDWLQNKTNLPVLGVLPFINGLYLDSEDAIELEQTRGVAQAKGMSHEVLRVVIPALPRISNHTDFDALRLHPQVDCQIIGPDGDKPPADLVILPGSKAVIADLEWLRRQGWEGYLKKHLRYGGKLIGICGGLQMLGHSIEDPDHIEGSGHTQGFGFLPISTMLEKEKTLQNRSGQLHLFNQIAKIEGYEIHHGVTSSAGQLPEKSHSGMIQFDLQAGMSPNDGWLSEDGQVFGSYLHGMFDHPEAQNLLLQWSGLNSSNMIDLDQKREQGLNRMADTIEKHMNVSLLERAITSFYQNRENHAFEI